MPDKDSRHLLVLVCSSSYYEFLGVPPSADAEALHSAFRRMSKDLHPDTTSLPSKEAAHEFQKLCEVYELLADPERRKVYDRSLAESNNLNNTAYRNSVFVSKDYPVKTTSIGFHRPFSGGELFSLLLLALSLIFSLFLAIILGVVNGKDMQVSPSWMLIDQSKSNPISLQVRNVSTAFFSNTLESSFSPVFRDLAAPIRC